jgi:ATP-dependent RNA helicase DDX51/DBP6
VHEFAEKHNLDKRLMKRMEEMGMTEMFPVQTTVIPRILSANTIGGDTCVCAPTGSGKTLAYAIPIVQVCGLRLPGLTV